MKFSEMPYERPDLEALKVQYSELTRRLESAGSYAEAKAVFLEKEELEKHVDTLGTLAHVRHSIDTRDAFYDEEAKFWNGARPVLQEYIQAWTMAMLNSPYRADFAKEYGDLMFVNAEMELKTFSPEIIPELQRENDLTQEYEKLLASAQIPFEGGVYTLSQMTPFKTDADDARRLAAWKAEGQWYKDNQDKLDALYDELVHHGAVRNEGQGAGQVAVMEFPGILAEESLRPGPGHELHGHGVDLAGLQAGPDRGQGDPVPVQVGGKGVARLVGDHLHIPLGAVEVGKDEGNAIVRQAGAVAAALFALGGQHIQQLSLQHGAEEGAGLRGQFVIELAALLQEL